MGYKLRRPCGLLAAGIAGIQVVAVAECLFAHSYLCKGCVPSVYQGATPLSVLTSWSLNLTRILPLISLFLVFPFPLATPSDGDHFLFILIFLAETVSSGCPY